MVEFSFHLKKLPSSFLPTEDQGMMYLLLSALSGASINRTQESLKKLRNISLKPKNNIEHLFTVAGFSFAGRAKCWLWFYRFERLGFKKRQGKPCCRNF